MSYLASAALSIPVGIAAVVAMLGLGSVPADVVCGMVVAAALVVFTRVVIRLAGESGDEPPTSENGALTTMRRATLIFGVVALLAVIALAVADNHVRPHSSPVFAVKEFVIASSLDDNGYNACRYLTSSEQHALSKAGAECRDAIDTMHLTLGSHHMTSLGDLARVTTAESIDGDRATVWLSRSGTSVEFQLVRASAAERNEFDAPKSPWRVVAAPGLPTFGSAPGAGQR